MGCRLPKLRKAEERRSPGKIYSTLRRPQVETKVGVAYTYHFLDFLLGKEEVPVSSVLCLSSVRELPVQVKELYAQGFVLVAVHPFVHPCGPRHARVQRQLHRAVLVRETHSSEKGQLKWAGRRLETDVCVAGHQAPDPEAIQNYVKRIQDMAEQGVMFVGFLQQPGGGPPCFLGPWDPDELSSLHSSPSPIHRHPFSAGASPVDPPEEPRCDVLQPEQNLSERHPSEPRDSDHDRRPEQCTQDRVLDPLKAIQDSELLGAEEPTERMHVLIHTSDMCPSEPTGPAAWLQAQDKNPAEVQGDPWSSPGPPEFSAGVGLPGRNSLPPPQPTDAEPKLGDSTETYLGPDPTETYLGPDLTETYLGPDSTETYLGPDPTETYLGPDPAGIDGELRRCWSSESWASSPLLNHSHGPESNDRASLTHNNNHIRVKSSEKEKKNMTSPPVQARLQLFALYNHMEETNSSLRFYSLRVPLRVLKEKGLTTEVDAHWLDHMTQHFTSGAHLVDGFFHLVENSDNGVLSVDVVFIFQSCAEETVATSYDAIVVEQWTVVDGVVVKTDYIPLLQSLAPFGWRLMCVLPTPIVRTNSDGSLSTKQILFLQRPTLQRKRKDFKMPNLRGRSKAKKNATPERERKNVSPATETEMEQLRSDTREEGREGVRHGDSGRREETSPQRDGEVDFVRDLSPPTEDGACHGDQEEETEIDMIPSAKSEKTVRWTDVCQREDGEDVKTHERIKRQLSERALFSGVC